ncbi:deSI-like protein At4g17486 isoform X2 [Lycium ferocissimum]|uniref:deSI-like protein At4g17486 isoform X2 n=1 Tax=Lycium ferocissimum TaxID=112874 RepID=UPI00281592A2|nr:deSI-like protein At4g17486 isoform X2 [Lycium ferocissimum]
MGEESTSKPDDNATNNYESPVILNVYDLTPANQYTVWFGFGIFHSGIEVHGMEYGYGAHDFPISGVFEVEPKSCPGFIYRCSVPLGRIKMPPSEFQAFLENVASEYHGDTYHLISKNCNHFTDDIAQRLTGKGIPGWINRLARAEEDGSGSMSSTTLHEPTESDDGDQDKHLLSPPVGSREVAFIREVQR